MNRILIILFLIPNLSYATQIVVSFSILQDIVQNIVPQGVTVESLLGADQDPHGYSLSARDYLTLKNAQIIISVGPGFDSWIESASAKVGSRADMYYVTKEVSLLKTPIHANDTHHHSDFDPHFWQSPAKTIEVIQKLSLHLEKLFPQLKPDIGKRTSTYIQTLEALQKKYKSTFALVPSASRKMIVAHNSFQYMAVEFGIQVDSPLDVSQEGESSLLKISTLTKKIRTEKIKSLFFEKSAPQDLIKTLSRETSTPVSGTLYSDALSQDEKASSYLKLLEYNFDLILNSMKDGTP